MRLKVIGGSGSKKGVDEEGMKVGWRVKGVLRLEADCWQ